MADINKQVSDLEEYKAIAYYRLSKDDKNEDRITDSDGRISDSILNQRKLVHAYLQNHPNITLVDEAYDDGYTGTNYDRPGFRSVLEKVQSGSVNCVIVKDLSRLGREYIETGKYLEMIFPSFGVRFIAINDDVDSEHSNAGDDIIIPIKNIMNESYCRELSKKLRNQFRIQRGNGEFLGAFASYGYCKSPDDKHKLIVDEYAAEVVRGIFSLKVKGYSQNVIADYLNNEKILPPAEYKKSLGMKYKTGFQASTQSKWSVVTINRILTNPIYIGTLVQGKRGTPNYKIKKMRVRSESDWSVVENNHQAIIDPLIFSTVQKMMGRDTRRPPDKDVLLPLAGVLFCPDCGRTLQRRTVTRGKQKYYYYVCANYKNGKGCSSHSIEQKKLEATVLRAVTNQIQMIVELNELVKDIGLKSIDQIRIKRLDVMIAQKEQDIDRDKEFRMKLYEALNDDLIDRDEYNKMRVKYTKRIGETEKAISKLQIQRSNISSNNNTDNNWIMQFIKFQNITELSHEAVVTLIDRIYVYEDKRIRIEFNYRNEFDAYQEILHEKAKEVG
ncbi:MAG: recombinase family protein [Ruminococcus flavefaciens]|nr:recombinase family protein [Ruminococcus flavefaciens]